MESKFTKIKSEILKRYKEAYAFRDEYRKAYGSETIQELMQVIKDNFAWSAKKQIIDAELIAEYANEFNKNNIYCNVDVSNGYLLASGHSTVEASGNSTVIAIDSSTVKAYGNSKVEAFNNSTVKVCDSSTVKAFNNSTVRACGNSMVEARDKSTVTAFTNSTVEARDNSTVEAWGNSMVIAYDNPTVKAFENSYVNTNYNTIECELSGNAIRRVRYTNVIQTANSEIKL